MAMTAALRTDTVLREMAGPRSRPAGALAAFAVVALVAWMAWPTVRSMAFLAQATEVGGAAGHVAAWMNRAVSESARSVPSRHGTLRARLYRPDGAPRRAVVLTPGVHRSGIDEPRLVGFARDLAAAGILVLTPELPDLLEYRITARETDMIEAAAADLARHDQTAAARVGLIGISFAGGLSVVAAGRASLRDRTQFVFSFGGHGDLPRVLRYLCTGIQPDGTRRPPHDYGVAVMLHGLAPRLVPADQAGPLRAAVLTFLHASSDDMVDKDRARRGFNQARAQEAALEEPARSLMHAVNERDTATLGAALLPHVEALGGDASLSPERSSPTAAPVFLLHGADDNVIPPIESELLARYLRPHARVRHLITPLVTHAEVDRGAAAADVWRLVRFWTALLSG
jgi:dienelactone hydrolase